MPTYPQGGPSVTMYPLLKQPALIARRLADLNYQRYIADRIFMRGTPEQVAGGGSRYQVAESIFPNRDAEEVATRANFPRATWTETISEATVQQFGLEIPINGLAIRRNQMDQMQRGMLKLSNAIVKLVDSTMVAAFLANGTVTSNAITGAGWDTDGRAMTDIATALKEIREENEGYNADFAIIHEDQHLDLMTDALLQASMPRESQVNPTMTGMVAPFMGLRNIYVTSDSNLQGKAIVGQSGMIGTIADEAVDPAEGYSTYQPQVGAPIHVKVYPEVGSDDWVIRGVRWPAMWIAEPGACRLITSI